MPTLVGDLPALIEQFEQVYNVPEFPFEPKAWQAFLDRNDAWRIRCKKCRKACEERQRGDPVPKTQRLPPLPPSALSDSSGLPSAQATPPDTPSESLASSSGSRSESDKDEGHEGVPMEWQGVQVPPTSRLMILFWAGVAKKRVARRQEWQAFRDDEEELGREVRPIPATLRRAAEQAETGEFSSEESSESSGSEGSRPSGLDELSESASSSSSGGNWRR